MKNKFLLFCLGLLCCSVQAQDYTSYLFAYFSGNWPDGEQVRYAVSDDGYNYRALNGGRPVVASDTIALKRGVRDPHIIRAQDGKTFYMVLTDMRSSMGWQSNDGIVLMKSTDLLHWEHTAIHFPERFPNLEGFDERNLHAVWAPQTIWDEQAGKYMIYYSIGRHDWEYATDDPRFNQPYFRIYYSYANEDFTDITEPQLLFDFGTAAIDGDIVYDRKNEEYVLFFKDEGRSVVNSKGNFRTRQGVMRATSKCLTGPYVVEKTLLEALNTDLVCDAINVAMREIFKQLVYGRSQTAFSENGLPVGSSLEDLGKVLRSQVGTMFGTKAKGVRYLEMTDGYVLEIALDKDDEVIGYKFCNLGKMMSAIKAGVEPKEAYEKAIGTYGRFQDAVRTIDPRKE